jgi:hypothetical protein
MNLSEILLQKASRNQLGHFYILETSAPEEKAFEILIDFAEDFIKNYFHKIEGQKQNLTSLLDHPDVFVLGNLPHQTEKSDKYFKVDEAGELNRFFEFKPIQGQRKFAVITEAHRINSINANKWLKLFEEPQGQSSIFLLNPRRSQLLSTVHSRAIHLKVPNKVETSLSSEWNDMITDLKAKTLSEFIESYSRSDQPLSFWLNELTRWEAEQTNDAIAKIEFSKWLKNYQEMETFHQPNATKWILFYSYLKNYVLPRLGSSSH